MLEWIATCLTETELIGLSMLMTGGSRNRQIPRGTKRPLAVLTLALDVNDDLADLLPGIPL